MGKGQTRVLSNIVTAVMVVTVIAVFVTLLFGRYYDIRGVVNEDERARHALTLAQVLLSSEKLAYTDKNKIYRDIFDVEKMQQVSQDSNDLFSEISYENSKYSLLIEDKENGKTWTIGNPLPIFKSFPVAIRYSESEIHVGMMQLGYQEEI